MLLEKGYFKLYANCHLVSGFKNCAIYDLQREKIFPVPQTFFGFLKKFEGKKITDAFDFYHKSEHKVLNEYFKFLIDQELIFFVKNPNEFRCFPEIDLKFKYPSLLSNVILAFDKGSNYKKLVEKTCILLKDVKCKNIQLRFSDDLDYRIIDKITNEFIETYYLRNIEIIIGSINFIELMKNTKIFSCPLINNIKVFGKDLSERVKNDPNLSDINLTIFDEKDFPRFRGLNKMRFLFFQPNLSSFTESLDYNLYFNRKCFIDQKGNIFQSPYSHQKMGNINENNSMNLFLTKEYQKYWNISKDRIKVCKDCEFRYVCNDGRIPKKVNNSNEYYYESECQYDPYSAVMKEN